MNAEALANVLLRHRGKQVSLSVSGFGAENFGITERFGKIILHGNNPVRQKKSEESEQVGGEAVPSWVHGPFGA